MAAARVEAMSILFNVIFMNVDFLFRQLWLNVSLPFDTKVNVSVINFQHE
ncbi:hypothetical protein PFUM301597_46160 [Pseudomonas fluorescens]